MRVEVTASGTPIDTAVAQVIHAYRDGYDLAVHGTVVARCMPAKFCAPSDKPLSFPLMFIIRQEKKGSA